MTSHRSIRQVRAAALLASAALSSAARLACAQLPPPRYVPTITPSWPAGEAGDTAGVISTNLWQVLVVGPRAARALEMSSDVGAALVQCRTALSLSDARI